MYEQIAFVSRVRFIFAAVYSVLVEFSSCLCTMNTSLMFHFIFLLSSCY